MFYGNDYIESKRAALFGEASAAQFKLSGKAEWQTAEIVSKKRTDEGVFIIISVPTVSGGNETIEEVRLVDGSGSTVGSVTADINRTAARAVKIVLNLKIKEAEDK